MTVRTIDDIFRDFNIDGVPASGTFKPHKPDIRDTLKKLLEGISTFPDNRVIRLNNANTGTANNIIVTASVAIPAAAYQVLYILNVTQENTGPVNVSGAVNRALVTNTSAAIPSGYLTPGMAVLCIDTGSALRMLSYGDMEVLVQAAQAEVEKARLEKLGAEAARDIAAGYASDAVSQGNVPIYATIEGMPLLEIPDGINTIRVNGKSSPDDGLGGKFSDFDTGFGVAFVTGGETARNWYRANDSIGASIWDGGTYRTMRDRARDTYCILDAPGAADPTGNNLSTVALEAMAQEANARRGLKLDLVSGNYRVDRGLEFNTPVEIVGRGRGYWHPKPPSSSDGVSSPAATQIILTGNALRSNLVHGISSMRASGGVIPNPSASNGNDGEYSLSSFMNSASYGRALGSRKPFSAGIIFKQGATGSIVSDLRVMPDAGGLFGMDKYVNVGLATDPWADDWDYGIVCEMASQMIFRNVECVGHNRRAGYLLLAVPSDPLSPGVPAIWGVKHENCQFSGWRAMEVRGPDMTRVLAVGPDYIDVPWWDDHPFDPSVYNLLGFGNGGFTLTVGRSFSSTEKIGDVLRLGGMASVDGIASGMYVTSRRHGAGTSHCVWDNACKFNGMNHQSGEVCHSAALGGNAMPNPGEAISISGWRTTELVIEGSIQTIEEVAIHSHAMAATKIVANLEGSGPKPARLLGTPHETANLRVSHPAGKTQNCIVDSARGLRNETGIDARPRFSTASASTAYPNDNGFFEGFDTQVPSLLLDAHGVNGARSNPRNSGLRAQPGMQTGLLTADGGTVLTLDEPSNVLRLARDIELNTNNDRRFGSITNRLAKLYTTGIWFSHENRFIQWGGGSPEGVISAVKGAIWLRVDGPAGPCMYIMENNVGGNTGWVLK